MGIRYKTTINGKGKGRGQPRQAKARTAAGVRGGGGCCENAPEFGQTHDDRWSQGANRAVFRHAGRNEKNTSTKPQVRELRDQGTPPCRIADHRLSSICPSLPPLFQQGGPQCRRRSNSSRFGSRMRVEGARTSGDVPPPARGALKRPHTQKREKRTKREEAFICEGA